MEFCGPRCHGADLMSHGRPHRSWRRHPRDLGLASSRGPVMWSAPTRHHWDQVGGGDRFQKSDCQPMARQPLAKLLETLMEREREREHHKKWIQIIQHVWKIFISFVFNHWGFWSHGGSQVILDFSLRNGKTWIIWDDDPQWDDESSLLGWVQGALNMADVTRKWWYHVILMSEFDGGRQLFEWCFFLSSFTTSKASCDMEYVYVYIYIYIVYVHTHIYIYTHCN